MRIVIATTQLPLVRGGAEYHAANLKKALAAAGHQTDIIWIPYICQTPNQVSSAFRFCLDLDLTASSRREVDCIIGLKFPAYLIPHHHKIQWIVHQERKLYDLWDGFSQELTHDSGWYDLRQNIHQLDTEIISNSRSVFANSKNVMNRLLRYNGIKSKPLYHPPPFEDLFHCEDQEDYFLFPSRIASLKRHELILEALSLTKYPVKVKFIGVGDSQEFENAVKDKCSRRNLNHRCAWLGWVTEDEKIQLYARCQAVIYPPYDEDLGYVTLESMLSSKPILTCKDSGGPLEFVQHEISGIVCDPSPKSLADAMDTLWKERSLAKSMGILGCKAYKELNLCWPRVVETLLQ